jgi:chromosome segregation ATPase
MERLMMKNGEYEFIRDKEDFINLVEKYMGEDSVEYLKELIESPEAVLEELDNYEANLEFLQNGLDDLQELILDIRQALNCSRLNRQQLKDKILNIESKINQLI